MKAKLKEMYSLELTQSLEEFLPDDKGNFGISIRLMIGSENSLGSDSFDIFVCTPDWIKAQYSDEEYIWGRHMLIVMEYDLQLIRRAVDHYIANCTGEDWIAISEKLSRMGSWEFEDYQP